MAEAQNKDEPIIVTEKDLPLHCPMPNAPLWSMHPRVFLDIADLRELRCPYCGALYQYQGPAPTGH